MRSGCQGQPPLNHYLSYGVGPASALLILMIIIARRRWRQALALCNDRQELHAIVDASSEAHSHSWVRGIAHGVGYFALVTVISFFVPVAERSFVRIAALYWIPAMIWALPGSWTSHMLSSVTNTIRVLGNNPAPPFVAYLRDRLEEKRVEVMGPPDQAIATPIQRGLERLTKSIPTESLYGFWDPYDDRTGLHFSPIISIDSRWENDVLALCERAAAIVLDVSTFSPSVAWEAKLIANRPDFSRKTLVLRAGNDQALPPELSDLERAARWFVVFDSRGDRGGFGKLDLPDDLLEFLGSSLSRPRLNP